ncbi:MAG: HAD family hydrolase [Desulfofustis sp.]
MKRQARFTTILFDLDGTLIDSLGDIAEAANSALRASGYPEHPVDRYRYFVGDGLMTLTRRIVPEDTAEERLPELAEAFRKRYKNSWNRTSRPYQGIDSMLSALAGYGVNLAVLSNKPDDFTQTFVASFFPDVPFGLVFGNRERVPKKPDPQAALEIAEYFDSDPSLCLFVGDTSVDILTAKAAGMMSIGVTWGFRDRYELERSGADIIIDKPAELIGHVINDR